MSAMTPSHLWQQLRENTLVEGDMPQASGSWSPWYVRLMLGVAGWIGALFLLGFVGTGFAFVMKNAAASLLLGALCCGAAFAIFRVARDRDFATQFGLAVSMAGQALFTFGLFRAFESDASLVYFFAFAFEVVLAIVVPNFVHRVITSCGAMFALTMALNHTGLRGFAPGIAAAGFAWTWLNEQRWATQGKIWRPIGYGLALALLQIDAFLLWEQGVSHLWSSGASGRLQMHAPWLGTMLVTVIFLWSTVQLLLREQIALSSRGGLSAIAAAILVGVVSFFAPGMATAFLILLLGFATGNRILTDLGLLALGGFISHYYYQLQTTLLMKSMVLAVSGSVLLLARLALQKWLPTTFPRGECSCVS